MILKDHVKKRRLSKIDIAVRMLANNWLIRCLNKREYLTQMEFKITQNKSITMIVCKVKLHC